MKNRFKISLLITKLSISQHIYVRYDIIRNTRGVVKTRNAGISRNMAEYHGIWRNITEYGGISRNMAEYHGISQHFPGIYRNITIFSDGSHATVYKHGRLTTYFITKVLYLSHFDGK
jgi:hypothetical protein